MMKTNKSNKKKVILILWGLLFTITMIVLLSMLLFSLQSKSSVKQEPVSKGKTNNQSQSNIPSLEEQDKTYNSILKKIESEVDELTNIKEIVYRPDGKTIKHIKILDSQTKKEIKRIVYDGADGKIISSIREFNPEGKLIKETFYLLDGKTISSIREFNPEGKQIKKTFYLLDGKTISSIREFNPEGKQIKKTFYKPDGTVKEIINY